MGKGKICETCKITRASFGYPGKNRVACKKCSVEGMVDLITKKCKDCKIKAATFGIVGGKHTHCKDCKSEDMVDVKNKKCEGCGKKQAFYGIEKPSHCSDCKLEKMTDLRSKFCIVCKKVQARYGLKKISHCVSCKTDEMVILCKNMCIGCSKKQPAFGYQNEKPSHCADCKKEDMIDLVTKKCIVCNKTTATFGYEGKEYLHCGKCKSDGMINMKDIKRKCKQEGCSIRGNYKYRGYCTHCFQHLFPEDPLIKDMYCKTYESKVKSMLLESGYTFIYDKPIQYSGCDCTSRRRVDFWKLIGNTILAIEVDENQHKYYNEKDEEIRYDDLFMHFSGKWIFIRFNPNKFKKSTGLIVNPRMEERLPRLLKMIDTQIDKIKREANKDLIEIHTLFFDLDI